MQSSKVGSSQTRRTAARLFGLRGVAPFFAAAVAVVMVAGCPNMPPNQNGRPSNNNNVRPSNNNNVRPANNNNAPPANNNNAPPANNNNTPTPNNNNAPDVFSVSISGCPSAPAFAGSTIALMGVATGGTGTVSFAWTATNGSTLDDNAIADPMVTFGSLDTVITVVATDDAGTPMDATDDDTAMATCSVTVNTTGREFTLSTDNLTGTDGVDLFTAELIFNMGSGTQIASLQTGDRANGLGDSDSLNASVNGTAITPTSILSIETINLTAFAATMLTATNISGTETYNTVNSTATVTVMGLQAIANGGITTVTDGASGLNMSFVTAATNGTDDEFTLTITGSNAGTATITTGAANGFEVLNIVSAGDSANTLAGIMQAVGTTLDTVNISGDQDLEITGSLNNTLGNLDTVDGGAANGALTLTFSARDLTVTTGAGDDELNFGTSLNSDDVVDTGAGTDVVSATVGASIPTALQLSNAEELRLNATADASVNLTGVSGVDTVSVTADGATNTLTLTNVGSFPDLDFRGSGMAGNQVFDGVTYIAAGSAGGNDSLNVTIGNRGTAVGMNNTLTTGLLTANSIESLTLTATDGDAVFAGITAQQLVSLTLSASADLTLGVVGFGAADAGATVTASLVTGDLSATFDFLTNSAQVTLGGGSDTVSLFGSSGMNITISGGAGDDNITGTDQADFINGGDGNDTLDGGMGADNITGGNGNDTITGGAGNDTMSGGAGNDIFVMLSTIAAAPVDNDGNDSISGVAVGDRIRFGAAPPALAAGVACTDNVTAVGNNGTDSTIIVDLDTDAAMTTCITITLPGVVLTNTNFMIMGNDIIRVN